MIVITDLKPQKKKNESINEFQIVSLVAVISPFILWEFLIILHISFPKKRSTEMFAESYSVCLFCL